MSKVVCAEMLLVFFKTTLLKWCQQLSIATGRHLFFNGPDIEVFGDVKTIKQTRCPSFNGSTVFLQYGYNI